ncbi:MAG: hypothetical protein E6K80_08275, partial [Candidatus Eisenbacteria bacterium]
MARSRDADRGRQHAGRRARRHLLGPHATDRGARRGGSAAGDRPRLRLPPHVPERGCDQAGRARGHHARHRRGSRAQQLHRPRQPVQAGRLNRDRPTIFVAASCDVGKFDSPDVRSLGEHLLFNRHGGAVGVVSATEEALSIQNAELNLILYQRLFGRDPTTGHFEA